MTSLHAGALAAPSLPASAATIEQLHPALVQVHPTPPPCTAAAPVSGTKATKLRQRHIQCLKEQGRFDSQAASDARATAEHVAVLQRRAAAHVAREQRKSRHRVAAGLLAAGEVATGAPSQAPSSPTIPAHVGRCARTAKLTSYPHHQSRSTCQHIAVGGSKPAQC
jgi:hypothetical protein